MQKLTSDRPFTDMLSGDNVLKINSIEDDNIRAEVISAIEEIPFLFNLTKKGRKSLRSYKRWDNPYDYDDREEDPNGRIEVDITEPHELVDMDYFRERALYFQKHGVYCHITPNRYQGSRYMRFWREEQRRCREGYVRESDGEWITGYHYWYLNYSPIQVTEEVKIGKTTGKKRVVKMRKAERKTDFPRIWDSDYLWFHYLEKAEQNGHHGVNLKSRGKGYSFKGSSNLTRNYYHFKKSNSVAIAASGDYLLGDGILNKAWDILNFIDNNTPWRKSRDYEDKKDHKKASYKDPKTKTERGILSEIMGVTTGGDPERARGKRAKLLLFEESGKFPHFKTTLGIARPSVEDGNNVFGLLIAFGTGGTIGDDFAGIKEAFYSPATFNMMGIPNVFDRKAAKGTECGFYCAEYMNRAGCYDENGNSDIVTALIETFIGRDKIKKSSNDPNALLQERADRSCVVGDTFISNPSIGSNKIINFDDKFINGIQDVYEVQTKYGRKLLCTKDHKIYNGNEYKELQQYDINDKIALKPLIPNTNYQFVTVDGQFKFDSYDIKIDEDWGRFLGFFNGDGSFCNNTLTIHFDEKDIESVEWVETFLEKTFGKSCRVYPKDAKMIRVSLHSIHLKHLLKNMGLLQKWKGNKHGYKRKVDVPNYIMMSPKSVISAYLQGYFDADSGIYKAQKNIKLFCKQKDNIRKIQYLLTAFDIYCQIKTEKKVNGEGRIYTGNSIVIRSWEVDKFKEIGYISKRKQDLLKEWTSYTSKPQKRNITEDYIETIKYVGQRPVYDIQTPEHNYSANGIWVHNCTPQEACMRKEGHLFNVEDLKVHAAEVDTNPKKYTDSTWKVKLYFQEGEVKWKLSDKDPVRQYPILENKGLEGCVEIFEHPVASGGGIPPNVYWAGLDVYDDDNASGPSLGSIQIGNILTRRIVAEYTGRPQTAEEFYEICYRLMKYYNARGNYENNKKGMFQYFDRINATYMLMDTPSILKDMQITKTFGNGNNAKGTNATKAVNNWGNSLIRSYLMEPAYGKEEGTRNYTTIVSPGMLKELIAYDPEVGNYDRIAALRMLLIAFADRQKYGIVDPDAHDNNDPRIEIDDFFLRNRPSMGGRFKSRVDNGRTDKRMIRR